MDRADIIVVGAGSAGATLAARLSENPQLQVLLVEVGERSRSFWVDIPIGYFKTVGDPQIDWGFETEPDPGMADRRLPWPRGKGPGGTSLINGMLYLRGHQRDYDQWETLGNEGWSWRAVLPYFRRSMHAEILRGAADGADGPLWVSDIPADPLSDAFIESAGLCGIPFTPDFNGGDNTGAGYYRMTTRNGVRMSTDRAYLRPAQQRPNLHVMFGAQTLRLTREGARITGVEVMHRGQVKRLSAAHEVVLSAGALQSPQLLQLSGLGPADLLRQHGVDVVLDLPGVGQNLQDHLQVRPSYKCRDVVTLNDVANSTWHSAGEFLRYVFARQGALRNGVYRAGAFFDIEPGGEPGWPNAQIHFGLVSFDRPHQPPHPFSGITLSACNLRPTSRGRIEIAGADPLKAPRIFSGYLQTETDQRNAVAMVRKMREIAGSGPLARYVVGEHEPGPALQTDEQILHWVRHRAGSIFHPVGTCAMGPEADRMAVVDARLRVHGVQGLRVVDGSIFPRIVSGNTNAPIIMVAERAADFIAQDLGAGIPVGKEQA